MRLREERDFVFSPHNEVKGELESHNRRKRGGGRSRRRCVNCEAFGRFASLNSGGRGAVERG